jgi:arginase
MEKLGFRFSEKIAIIKAPSALGLTKTGVEGLADALLSAGLADQFFAIDAGTVTPPKHSPSREQQTGFINAQAIA